MTSTFARRISYLALPVVSAGVIGGAALGLAGTANASAAYDPQPRPGIVATPQVIAPPAPSSGTGMWWHRHHPSLLEPTAAAEFIAPGA